MGEALALAQSAFGVTEPNPRVGCVIGTADGRILGQGATQRAGGPHAEAMALQDAARQGNATQGSTAWVTLEPCAHHGRTPPCCDALIRAGIARVVVALVDPFPQVAGTGIARLRAHGVQIDACEEDQALAAWEMNLGFFSRVQRTQPWVRLKLASSLDGRTALDNGQSQWITSPEARADGHRWRARASAILTGIGTVLADDPRLDARLPDRTLTPLRIVLDSQARLPASSRLLDPPGQVLLATTADVPLPPWAAMDHVRHLQLPSRDGRIDLAVLMTELARQGVNELHVEAGSTLATGLLQQHLVDEVLLYVAPRLLGGSRGLVTWPPLDTLQQSINLRWSRFDAVGPDLRLEALTDRGWTFREDSKKLSDYLTDPAQRDDRDSSQAID